MKKLTNLTLLTATAMLLFVTTPTIAQTTGEAETATTTGVADDDDDDDQDYGWIGLLGLAGLLGLRKNKDHHHTNTTNHNR